MELFEDIQNPVSCYRVQISGETAGTNKGEFTLAGEQTSAESASGAPSTNVALYPYMEEEEVKKVCQVIKSIITTSGLLFSHLLILCSKR